MIYRFNDIRMSDLKFGTLSLGNIPIKFEQGRVAIEDPNPTATPPTDIDGCDTPNFSLRTCDAEILNYLRTLNNRVRNDATQFLIKQLGGIAALQFADSNDLRTRAAAAFFGRMTTKEIDAIKLPPRTRNPNANPLLPTSGDPDFRRRSGSYRSFRRRDSHPQLLDSSWVGPASRHSSEIVK
jgi:hypothetical protein